MDTRLTGIPGLAAILAVLAAPAMAQDAMPAPAPAPATPAPAIVLPADDGSWDPFQAVNRATFSFNAAMSTVIVEPLAGAYRQVIPEPVRSGIDNVFTNLREPLTTVSSGLQGDFENAGLSAGRFAINTTAGIGGIWDVATPMGWVSRPADLGMTLCSYGIKPGPYIVLPFLGPSNGRDAVALLATYSIVSNYADDYAFNYIVADRAVAAASDEAATEIAEAADPYLAQRDTYLALRKEVCDDSLAAKELKASPLGSVVRVPG